MKPVLIEGKLSVELTVNERKTLDRAREIGVLLESLHQETGAPLVAAIDSIMPIGSEL
jgi:hypothetical protein